MCDYDRRDQLTCSMQLRPSMHSPPSPPLSPTHKVRSRGTYITSSLFQTGLIPHDMFIQLLTEECGLSHVRVDSELNRQSTYYCAVLNICCEWRKTQDCSKVTELS